MSEILTNNKYYSDIADTIRQMKGVATTYKPREMASALRDMYSTEVEGVPPLSFPSNGNNLLNYRIDGANGGVGDRTKNLLENTATTQTINGITVTVNDDKSINLSGTSSELTYVDINTNFNSSELAGYYLKLIFPENYVSATSSIIVRISSQNSRTSLQDFTTTKLINDNGNNNRLAIRINGNYTIPDNFKLYLMVSQNSNDNYEPYIEPTTTNIYLDEPIGANESESLSDTNVNIPTINGTNILSIDTTVQPSNVYVQAPKTNNYNL